MHYLHGPIEYSNIGDDDIVATQWTRPTLKLFQRALARYLELLSPHSSQGYTKIQNEVSLVKALSNHFREVERNCEEDFDLREVDLRGEHLKLLSDVLHKYEAQKHDELRRKKTTNSVEGALEKEEAELEDLRNILRLKIFQETPRRAALVQGFHTSAPAKSKDNSESGQKHIKQNINVGTLYGQFVAGDNYGSMQQDNSKELRESLQKLLELLSEEKVLESETKRSAISDIQVIQNESVKTKPNKRILKFAWDSLKTLPDLVKITEMGMKIQPHIEEIGKQLGAFLNKL
jgi:hypothetical protein